MGKGSFEELVTLVQDNDLGEAAEWLQELASERGITLDREWEDEMILHATGGDLLELQIVWKHIVFCQSRVNKTEV